MRLSIKILVFMLLIFSACEKHEEVLPIPLPPAQNPEPVTQEGITEEEAEEAEPPLDLESESYQYGSFRNMPYRILLPRNYDSTRSYPLHVFLHGIGERGVDNERQLSVGSLSFQADSIREKYPSFIIFPQCPDTHYWFSEPITTKLKALLVMIEEKYPVNEGRISIGGYSMGAYGTFAMTAQNPGFFDAAVAISGDGDEEKAPLMSSPRWQIFAGQKDDVVPSSRTQRIATALTKAGASVVFTLYPHADHSNTWMNAFSEPDFFNRLFETGQPAASADPK